MPQLFAQPYDLSATGFYFDSVEAFDTKANAPRNNYGQRVEEFEIQFIDGDELDCELAGAISLTQANFAAYLEGCEVWEEWQKTHVIIAVGECGYGFDSDKDPSEYDIDVYHVDNLREFAEQLVEDGILGDIPDNILPYFDFDAFARDLSVEYSEITIAGDRMVYRAS
ncbi:antirestriction protein ArdA [uncultured Roseobacter sp.]|uniref:antirestriction protein ArdA n=1 Tax=uncultured Roseobacter sp. TaxID=114847 RepID=UPI002607D09A|nr:antirestriction protein ArdA [uncultured Roseobacter sp.]